MKLIAGLGNPGRSYSRHRHNVGYFVLNELAHRHDIEMRKRSFGALTGSGAICGESVLLAKPETFMNLSGDAVAPLLGYYKLDLDSLIVIHDDLDIDIGKIKIMKGAGHGGHNGVSSIIDKLGSNEFTRIRVGIGRPPEGIDGADFVLSSFIEEEKEKIALAIKCAADAIELILEKGVAAAQQKYH